MGQYLQCKWVRTTGIKRQNRQRPHEVTSSSYDETKGLLVLEVSFTYSGEQDQDRPYAGCEFYLDVEVTLVRRPGEWLFEEGWVAVTKIETDQDRDREAELADMYADYLKDKKRTDGM